jgi:hypothetical protein
MSKIPLFEALQLFYQANSEQGQACLECQARLEEAYQWLAHDITFVDPFSSTQGAGAFRHNFGLLSSLGQSIKYRLLEAYQSPTDPDSWMIQAETTYRHPWWEITVQQVNHLLLRQGRIQHYSEIFMPGDNPLRWLFSRWLEWVGRDEG